MAGIKCYLNELDKQRDRLANILTEKGIPSDESEKYNDLVDKVAQLGTGGGNAAPVYVAGGVESLDSEIDTTTYEVDYPANLCEMATTADQNTGYGNCSVTFKPRGECLLVAYVMPWGTRGEEGETELTNQMLLDLGFEPLTAISLYSSETAVDSNYEMRVYTKHSNGGTVYLQGNGNIRPYHRFKDINFVALYGATSVTVVQSENPAYDTTCSFATGTTENTWYGFTTPAPTGKPRIYCYGNVIAGGQKYISTDAPPNTQPDEYTPTIEPYGNMIGGIGGKVCFDDQTHDGIRWWVDSKTGDSSSYTPKTSREHGIVILDVNYD